MNRLTVIPAAPKMPDWRTSIVRPSNESLVSLSDVRPDRLAILPRFGETVYVREMVLNLLLMAASRLPEGHRLVIWDGWRPFQPSDIYVHEEAITDKVRASAQCHSCLDFHHLNHLSGGAVDVTFMTPEGVVADLGELSLTEAETSLTRFYEEKEAMGTLTTEEQVVLNNRRILYQAMTAVGFTNCPDKWWHFDFGNQHWAALTGKLAFYASTEPEKAKV